MKKSLVSVAVVAALLASPAFAQLYIGAGLGETRPHGESSWKVYLGYQFVPMFGVELGFTDLGRQHGFDLESTSIAGVATFPMNERWSALAKLGANRPHSRGADGDTEILAGVGVEYSITPKLAARLEYEDFGRYTYNREGNKARAGNFALSLNYGF